MMAFEVWWIFPIVMIIVMLLMMTIMMVMRSGIGRRQNFSGHHSETRKSETALERVEKRYASGEITKEEFEQIKSDLSG